MIVPSCTEKNRKKNIYIMKTTSFRFILAALAATAALVGCTKEITPNFENDKVNPEGTRVIAVSFAPQTKTELDGFQPKFVDNDSILISNGVAIDTCEVKVESEVATITTNLTGPLTAVYPYKAAKMNENDENLIDTVLVSTVQDGTFASANICMASMTDENEESLSFENKTAVFCIKPAAGASSEYVEVSADGFEIANDVPTGSTHTSLETIHVNTTTADSVYVSILVPEGLKVSDLTFSDGTNEKTVTGDKASTKIAAGTLYTVTNANWESTEADIPDGALKGVFSVSADKQVYFSQGNLYAKKDNNGMWNWGFYAKQYQYNSLSTSNPRTAQNTDTEIDLFTWGYSESTSLSPTGTDYVTGHPNDGDKLDYEKVSSAGGDDWGVAYCESNNITVGTWRTLTTAEWQYLFNRGSYTSEVRNGKYKYGVTVCGKANCVVLLPDGWKWEGDVGTEWQTEYPETQTNNEVTWQKMEDAGAVCLTAAGHRDSSTVTNFGDDGSYWSSTAGDEGRAYYARILSRGVNPDSRDYRYFGYSVRLVTDVSAAPTPTPTDVDYIEIKAKYNGTDSTILKWSRQNLAITDSGNKPWKGGNESAVKVPGTNDDVVVGDYFQWAAYAGYCGDATATDKGLLIYDSFLNTKCVDGGSEDSFALKSAGGSDKYQFITSNSPGYVGISPYYSGSAYTQYTSAPVNLDSSDDVANIILGDNWRMPTSAEFQAMREATYWAWDGADKGYYVYVPNPSDDAGKVNNGTGSYIKSDALLFFPAAGIGEKITLYDAGSVGHYWTSTLYSTIGNAYFLSFSGSGITPYRDSRYRGRSVRPVSDL